MTATLDTPTTEYRDRMPVARLRPDPNNPRRNVTVDDDFVASVRNGIWEPLLVTPDPDDNALLEEPTRFLIVMGHRRHAAAQQVGLDTVPCIIRTDLTDPAARLAAQLVENGQREDLAPLEEADAFAQLVELGVPQRELGARVGRSQSHVSKRLSLRKLPPRAKVLLDSGRIGVENALGLTGLITDSARMARVLDFACARGDVTDRDIGQRIFRELDEIKHEQKRVERTKDNAAKIEELRARGLTEIDDRSDDFDWDAWEEIDSDEDEANATAFSATDNHIILYKPVVPPGNDASDAPATEQGNALAPIDRQRARHDSEAESAEAETKLQERRTLTETLAGDGYPDDERAVLLHIARISIADTIARDGEQGVCDLLGLEYAADADNVLLAYCALGDAELIRAAFANALDLGQDFARSYHTDPYSGHGKAEHLRLLEQYGYELTPADRLFVHGDTIPDGGEIDLSGAAVSDGRDVAPVVDVATTDTDDTDDDRATDDHDATSEFAGTFHNGAKGRKATVPNILAWVRGGPISSEPSGGWKARARAALTAEQQRDKPRTGIVDTLTTMLATAGTTKIAEAVTGTHAGDQAPARPDQRILDGASTENGERPSPEGASAPAPPWKNYANWTTTMITNSIAKADDRDWLDRVDTYESAHDARPEILAAILARHEHLDEWVAAHA